MKIVHVVESFGGGVYSFLTELCNELAKDYEVVIIYSERKETPKQFRKDFNNNIKFIKIDMCRGLNPYKNSKSLFQLKSILKKENADVIHLHSSKAGFLGRIASYCNRFNMGKVFYNPHGFSFLQRNENKLKRNIFLKLEQLAARFGGCIVGCSKGEYEEALKISNKCININNGIDTIKIDEMLKSINLPENFNDNEINSKKVIVGTVGRICFQKNPKLFNKIAERYPEYSFLWIGDGELRSELVSSNIEITGWMERKEVIRKLCMIDIYIMTSLWEGLPISLLEAMYMEKPVIVSDVIGNRDVIKNNENGCICNEENEFISKIKLLVENYKFKIKIKKNAKDSVIKFYNINVMLEKYKQVYMKLGSNGD